MTASLMVGNGCEGYDAMEEDCDAMKVEQILVSLTCVRLLGSFDVLLDGCVLPDVVFARCGCAFCSEDVSRLRCTSTKDHIRPYPRECKGYRSSKTDEARSKQHWSLIRQNQCKSNFDENFKDKGGLSISK